MYNKEKAKKPIYTLDWILSKVTEYDIYASYLGEFKVGLIYNSPFREDKNPSFGIYYSKRTQQLLFKDHGTGQCGNVIKFVSLITGKTNYDDILEDIVNHTHITNRTKLASSKHYIPSTETIIGVVRQDFTETDKKYWSQFNIGLETLKMYHVSSIKYYLCNGIVKGIYKDDNPMYAYKVYNHFKIYRPLADKYHKWRNNLEQNDIQGYEQLPEVGDLLIITKSMKDVMCFHEMGYNAISPASESTFISENILELLKKRFNKILICFDRDKAGVTYLRKICKKTKLEGFLLHKSLKSKDVSDSIKLNGFEKTKNFIDKVITKSLNYHYNDKKD